MLKRYCRPMQLLIDSVVTPHQQLLLQLQPLRRGAHDSLTSNQLFSSVESIMEGRQIYLACMSQAKFPWSDRRISSLEPI